MTKVFSLIKSDETNLWTMTVVAGVELAGGKLSGLGDNISALTLAQTNWPGHHWVTLAMLQSVVSIFTNSS